jgi:hypothetical protein
LVGSGAVLHYTLQNAAEFWNVFTRPPERNGLGLTPAAATRELRQLITKHNVSGVKVHDARLVASMLAHRIPQLLTLNCADFERYANHIRVVHPNEIS